MTAPQLYLVMNLVVQLLVIHAFCRILHMRSNVVFGAVLLGGIFLSSFLSRYEGLSLVRVFVLNPLVTAGFPLAYSQGPLRRRIARVAFVLTALAIPEILSSFLFSLMSGRTFPADLAHANTIDMALCYLVSLPAAALTLEAVVACCAYTDREEDAALNMPVLALMASSYVLSIIVSLCFDHAESISPLVPLITLICAAFTLILITVTLAVAHEDARATRQLALQTALARQIRHLAAETQEAARRTHALQRMRHDLANQVDTMRELARQGNVVEADRNLAHLQQQAQALAEGLDGHA